mgnify:FL=1
MTKYLFLFTTLRMISYTSQKKELHPKDAWVFGSVLDGMVRIDTAATDKELCIAYDIQNRFLSKV